MKAPRCGAKTRAGGCACRQPAMANGRCRFHGGKSTGARTAAGRARCARARRTHGFYSAETVALRREAGPSSAATATCSPPCAVVPLDMGCFAQNPHRLRRGALRAPAFLSHRFDAEDRAPSRSAGARSAPLHERIIGRRAPLDMGCFARFCVLPPAGLGYSPAPAPDSHPAPESAHARRAPLHPPPVQVPARAQAQQRAGLVQRQQGPLHRRRAGADAALHRRFRGPARQDQQELRRRSAPLRRLHVPHLPRHPLRQGQVALQDPRRRPLPPQADQRRRARPRLLLPPRSRRLLHRRRPVAARAALAQERARTPSPTTPRAGARCAAP